MAMRPDPTIRPNEAPRPLTLKEKINKLLTLHKFIGCCSLRTGCLVIGYVNTIVSLAIFVLFIYIITMLTNPDGTVIMFFTFEILIFILVFALHVVLLYGVYQQKRKPLTVYFRSMVVLLIIFFIIDLVIICFSAEHAKHLAKYPLHIYSLLVVRSYKMKLPKPGEDNTQLELP